LTQIQEEEEGFEELMAMPLSVTLENVLSFVSDSIKSLLRISMSIRNPAPQSRYLLAKSIDTSFYEAYDVEHVRASYAEHLLPEFLAYRLGRANTARRQFLKYSKDHRARLASGLKGPGYEDGNTHEDSKSTIATSLPRETKDTSADRIPRQDNVRDDVSQTTINTTAPGIRPMKVVPFPENAEYNEEFECPLCYCIIQIRDWNHWK